MNKKPKILLFDIEIMANLGYVWAKYEQNVISYQKQWYMLSFAYKWYGDKSVRVCSLPDFKSYTKDKSNDKELVKELWKLFDEADIVIAHNGNSYDVKKANAKFVEHGLTPPSPYKKIDTKLVAKRYFNFNSNKLDDLGELLGLGRKNDTGGFELWLGCASGDISSWAKMCRYNRQDVVLLEKIYQRLLPWIENHPKYGIYSESKELCPNCGSSHTQKRGFGVRGNSKLVQRIQCQDCGTWSQQEIKKDPKILGSKGGILKS